MPTSSLDPKDPVLWTLGGGIVLAIYKFIRMIKGDVSADSLDKRKDKLLDEQAGEIKTLKDRCDVFAQQRNAAEVRAVKAETELAHVKALLADAEEERIDDLRSCVARCQGGATCGAAKLLSALTAEQDRRLGIADDTGDRRRLMDKRPAQTNVVDIAARRENADEFTGSGVPGDD